MLYKNLSCALSSSIRLSQSLLLLAFFLLLPLRGTIAYADEQNYLDLGFRDMYNLAFSEAHKDFATWIQKHPDDPMGPAADAAAYLFSEFDRLGILDSELFADNQRFEHRQRPTPDSTIKAAFLGRLNAADKMADERLKTTPHDAHLLFTKTLVNGLRSDYQGLIEKSDLSALVYSKRAGELAKQTLAADPGLYDAYVGVGVENYILGLKPAPVRWVLNMAGAETNKQEGLRELQLTAEKGSYLAPFARLLLAVAAIRDKQISRARELLAGLSQQFPGNTLYARELARLH
jgi:hypothetical protein